MEGPATKRVKLLSESPSCTSPSARNISSDWLKWYNNLEALETVIFSGCLCQVNPIELHSPILSELVEVNVCPDFPKTYTLQFMSIVKLLCETCSAQQSLGSTCQKLSEIVNSLSRNKEVWELLLQLLSSTERFISFASSKALFSLIMVSKLPNLDQVLNEILSYIFPKEASPSTITNVLDIIQSIIEYTDEEEHPLGLRSNDPESVVNPPIEQLCTKLNTDENSELEIELKSITIKTLELSWTRILIKIKGIISTYDQQYEHCIIKFFSLWQYIVSVKSNLDVIDTKQFFMNIDSLVSFLKPDLPPVLWKKLVDLFNEILCYGSTLSLQDSLPEEPCELAHTILRGVKNHQLLNNVPFSPGFHGFGGTKIIKPVDFKWESDTPEKGSRCSNDTMKNEQEVPNPSTSAQLTVPPNYFVSTTVYIGPSQEAINIDDTQNGEDGDRPLLQKVVLMVLKSIAVTVKETKDESDCSDDDEEDGELNQDQRSNNLEVDTNDMIIIGNSIREVLLKLDTFVKSLLPFHPSSPIAEWTVKLFSDQDDVLVEGMLCLLDSFTSFSTITTTIEIPEDFYKQLNPVTTFMEFGKTISQDKDVLLDLLMSNETCFLLYLLRYLKYIFKNWSKFICSSGRELDSNMSLLIRLKVSLDRLVEKALFPYNINPVIRLLEKCERLYETS